MNVLVLFNGQHKVYLPTEDDLTSPVIDFLEERRAQGDSAPAGIMDLLKRFSEVGPMGLSKQQFHEADKGAKVWQFSKGKLRLYCFFDRNHGDCIVLVQAALKKTGKAEPKFVKGVKRERDRYEEAQRRNEIQFHVN